MHPGNAANSDVPNGTSGQYLFHCQTTPNDFGHNSGGLNAVAVTRQAGFHRQQMSADKSQNSGDRSLTMNSGDRNLTMNSGDRNLTLQERMVLQAYQQNLNFMASTEPVCPSPGNNVETLFEQALRDLPMESKSAYLQAREQQNGLDLVSRESPFLHFLQMEDNDVWAGAMRMAEYWTRRKEIFGAERAFKPLDVLNGSGGALTRNDIDLMATCFLMPITENALSSPSNQQQQRGGGGQHPIVFSFDRSRAAGVPAATLLTTLIRSLFYWCYLVKDHDSTRTEGITCIAVINSIGGAMGRMDPKLTLNLVRDALPIKIKEIHICLLCSANKNNAVAVPGLPNAADEVLGLKQRVLPMILNRFESFLSIDYHVHLNRIPIAKDFGSESPLSCERFLIWFKFKYTYEGGGEGQGKRDRSDEAPSIIIAPPSAADVAPASSPKSSLEGPVSARMFSTGSVTSPTQLPFFVENMSVWKRAVQALEEAIEFMADSEKAAYVSAKKSVPYLVEMESDPLRFLRFVKFDSWAAARMLVQYWSVRVKIFGNRAFLPMTISGDGAMSPEDILLMIDSGYITHMPPDADGRSFLVLDVTRRRTESPLVRLRAAFYNVSVVCENERSATEGYSGIFILDAFLTKPKFDNTLVDAFDVAKIFPTFAHKVHVVKTPTGFGERVFLELLIPLMNGLFQRFWNDNYIVHVGTKEQLMQKLADYSITQRNLPDALGGLWTMEHHRMWMRDRVRIENARYSRMSMASPANELRSSWAPENNPTPEGARKMPARDVREPPMKKNKAESMGSIIPLQSGNSRTVDHRGEKSLDDGLKELDEAINSLPAESKAAYLQALKKDPELIKKESNPESFLRNAQFDASFAAKKLARYWEVRSQLFGSKAFSPIDQTGEGGLDRRDLAVLGTAYLMCLPKDKNGRSVVFCDGIRLTKCSKQSRLRVSFYIFSIAAAAKMSQNDGFVFIHVCTEPSFDRANKECLDVILSAIPAHIGEVHLLKEDKNTDERFSDKIDPTILQHFRQLAGNKVTTHIVATRPQMSRELHKYLLDIENLPKSIGGGFGYARFVQWQELRTRWEWGLPPGNKHCEENAEYDFSKIIPLGELNEEERTERKRRQNIIHSRRKRERERIEMELLDERRQELTDENKDLKIETARLTRLLSKANSIINAN